MQMCVRCPKCLMFDVLKFKSVAIRSLNNIKNNIQQYFSDTLFDSPVLFFSFQSKLKKKTVDELINHLFIPTLLMTLINSTVYYGQKCTLNGQILIIMIKGVLYFIFINCYP